MIPLRGDIVLFRMRKVELWANPLTWLIRKFQQQGVSHTAMLLDPSLKVIVEAWWPRARKAFLDDDTHKVYEYAIVRPRGVELQESHKAADFALTYVGTWYDGKSLFSLAYWYLLERVFGFMMRDKVYVKDDPRKFFCQELVTTAYDSAGFDLTGRMGFQDPSAITPGDIEASLDKFTVVTTSPGW